MDRQLMVAVILSAFAVLYFTVGWKTLAKWVRTEVVIVPEDVPVRTWCLERNFGSCYNDLKAEVCADYCAEAAAIIRAVYLRAGSEFEGLTRQFGDPSVLPHAPSHEPIAPTPGWGLDLLVRTLQDPDTATRIATAKALGALGDPQALSYLTPLLSDKAWGIDPYDLLRVETECCLNDSGFGYAGRHSTPNYVLRTALHGDSDVRPLQDGRDAVVAAIALIEGSSCPT